MPKFTASLNLPKYADAPSSPVDGDVYYNTADHKVYSRINGAWVDLADSGSGSGDVTLNGVETLTNKTLTDPQVTGKIVIDNNGATPISIDSSEGTQLHAVNQDSLITRTVLDAHGTDVYGAYSTRRSRGTAASPTAVESGDKLGELSVRGYGETSFPNVSSGRILFSATENHTDTNRGTKAVIQVTPNGASSTDDALIVTPSGVDLPLGSSYKINNTSVLSGSTLESSVVNSSLTSVGTISTGTWNGTVIEISYGGTGHDTAAEAINALLPVQTSHNGKFLTTDGTDPSWSALDNITLDGGGV